MCLVDGEVILLAEAERREALEAYAQRMEYFASLPAWMGDDFREINEQGPEKWGLTRGEWDAYALDRWEHIREGIRLGDLRAERSRRLSGAARAAVEACADVESARAVRALYGLQEGPRCDGKTDAETMREYVARTEREADERAGLCGAIDGMRAVCEREREKMNRELKRRFGKR